MSDIITNLIDQAEKIKNTQKEIWIPEFDTDVQELNRILRLYECDPNEAASQFNLTNMSQFNSFGEYIKSKAINAVGYKFSATTKTTSRSKKCPNCKGIDFEYVQGTYVCKNCGMTVIKKKVSQATNKDNLDDAKHIMKQLNAISGRLLTPPANITKIMKYIVEWFTNKSHLRDWLIYSNRLEAFKEKYKEITDSSIDLSYFEEEIKPGVENLCDYGVFKMITDEFYLLTDYLRIYNTFTSNMVSLPVENQIDICKHYLFDKMRNLAISLYNATSQTSNVSNVSNVSTSSSTSPVQDNIKEVKASQSKSKKKNSNKNSSKSIDVVSKLLPRVLQILGENASAATPEMIFNLLYSHNNLIFAKDLVDVETSDSSKLIKVCLNDDIKLLLPTTDEVYNYLGINYEIGKYIVHHQITDISNETPIKQEICKIFNQNILLPGLIFTYSDLCGTKGSIPKKFNYQQNYIFIIKDVYKIELIPINETDKQTILNIMIDFNNYIKTMKASESGKKHNACLWQVALMFILELPYYRCYADIIKILPIKSLSTIIHIKEYWSQYLIDNYEKLDKYRKTLRTKCIDTSESKTIVYNGEVDVENVYDFINGTGTCYKNNEEDAYLKEKLNIKDNQNNEWTKNVAMFKDMPKTEEVEIRSSENNSDDDEDRLSESEESYEDSDDFEDDSDSED